MYTIKLEISLDSLYKQQTLYINSKCGPFCAVAKRSVSAVAAKQHETANMKKQLKVHKNKQPKN